MSIIIGVCLIGFWVGCMTWVCLSTSRLLFVESAKRLVGRCGRS